MSGRKYYLAVDIGASSGRHMLAYEEDGKIFLEEIYRFYNGMSEKNGHLVWDTDRLFHEIAAGMKKCGEEGKTPVSMGIDTWGVDFCLLDKDGNRLGDAVAYRDSRTADCEEKVYSVIPEKELYRRTGIQKAVFNTIFQLEALKDEDPELLEKADSLLMIPDYFHWKLTGVRMQEYTNATTTGLVDANTGTWDTELTGRLGFPQKLFGALSLPGTVVGELTPEIQDIVGYNCRVILPATHDTGSAVMSVPKPSGNCLYISSGTWSLMGCELDEPDCSERARLANFTNEGGFGGKIRFLKNIMGLWMIQSVKKELEEGYSYRGRKEGEDYSFANLCARAKDETIDSIVDVNDERFLSPRSMTGAVRSACRESGQAVPETPWELARVIYRSLAKYYAEAAAALEDLTGLEFDAVNIVGGGANAEYLNILTAQETGRKVYAGPAEATAIGNIGAQMIADGVFADLPAFRESVIDSFGVKCYGQ